VDASLGQPAIQNAVDLVNDADRVVAANDSVFGTTGGPVSVMVFAMDGNTDGTGGADHMGCDYTTGAAIEVCASFGNSARVSALFEAQLSECSMGGNLCGLSTGEALSRWCAAEIGNNALSDFATAPTWAESRRNFVDRTDPTDGNAISTGCGMAFLSWLISQGYALNAIAPAMVSLGDSGTLAQLYAKLTGDAGSNAWPLFTTAVNALPDGVTTDDPFGEAPHAAQVASEPTHFKSSRRLFPPTLHAERNVERREQLLVLRDWLTQAVFQMSTHPTERLQDTFLDRHHVWAMPILKSIATNLPIIGRFHPSVAMVNLDNVGLGITGFGVGAFDNSEPRLYVFTDDSSEQARRLVGHLASRVPVELMLNANFVAAARPVQGGDSIGLGAVTGETGTIGCIVKDKKNGDLLALSCNHVIAGLNEGECGITEVWSPGVDEGGSASDRIGVLHRLLPIRLSRSDGNSPHNDVDAAVAKPDTPRDLDPRIRDIGRVKAWTTSIMSDDRVRKFGQITKMTEGRYRIDVSGLVNFPNGKKALFHNLLGVVGVVNGKNFAERGDSGAVLVNDKDEIVGQIISVTTGIDLTLATRSGPIFSRLGVEPY
jgi:hypothetical protein